MYVAPSRAHPETVRVLRTTWLALYVGYCSVGLTYFIEPTSLRRANVGHLDDVWYATYLLGGLLGAIGWALASDPHHHLHRWLVGLSVERAALALLAAAFLIRVLALGLALAWPNLLTSTLSAGLAYAAVVYRARLARVAHGGIER